jgi:hypothetical protein
MKPLRILTVRLPWKKVYPLGPIYLMAMAKEPARGVGPGSLQSGLRLPTGMFILFTVSTLNLG